MSRNTRAVFDTSIYPLEAGVDPLSVGLEGKGVKGNKSSSTKSLRNSHHHSLVAENDDSVLIDHGMETYVYSRHSKSQRRSLYCWVGWATALLSLLVMIPLLVMFSKNKNKETQKSVTASVISDPPSYLQQLCLDGFERYRQQDSNLSNWDTCIDECEVSDCCFLNKIHENSSDTNNLFQGGEVQLTKGSCYEGNENACGLYYNACHPLLLVGSDADGDEEGNATTADGLLDDNFGGGGEGLNNKDDNYTVTDRPTLPDLPENIQTTWCSPQNVATEQGRNACQAVCKPAECCKYEEKLPQSCLGGENDQKCMMWQQACAALVSTSGSSSENQRQQVDIEMAPSSIIDNCSPAGLATEYGMKACSAICEDAQCCFTAESGVGNYYCVEDTDCSSYAPCLHLFAMSQTDNSVQVAVDQVCTTDTVQDAEGFAQCLAICMQHACCWKSVDKFSCPSQVEDTCSLYSSCKFLEVGGSTDQTVENNDGQPTLDPPPQSLAEICEESYLMTTTGTDNQAPVVACELACNKAQCCDIAENLDGSCLRGNEAVCMAYHKECSVLNDNIGYTPSSTTAQVLPAPSDLEIWCAWTGSDNPTYRQLCIDWCSNSLCCWSLDLEQGESCRDNSNCPGYAYCLNLRAGNQVDSAITAEVMSKCTEESISTDQGLEDCRNVCFQHQCCWDQTNGGCYYGEDACDQYSACAEALGVTANKNPFPEN